MKKTASGKRATRMPADRKLVTEILNDFFPNKELVDERRREPIDLVGDSYVPISNSRLAQLIAAARGRDYADQVQKLKIQVGRYRRGISVPNRETIGDLSVVLGVPPMVLLLYARRFSDFFGYIRALVALSGAPNGWPFEHNSPRYVGFALGFATFPRAVKGSHSAARVILDDFLGFLDHFTPRESDHLTGPLIEYVASDRDQVTTDAGICVDVSTATWIFDNIPPVRIHRGEMLYRAVEILNDGGYPEAARFEVAALIFDHWCHSIDSGLADGVLKTLEHST